LFREIHEGTKTFQQVYEATIKLDELFAPRRAQKAGLLGTRFRLAKSWRRGESNPRPKSATKRSLHA